MNDEIVLKMVKPYVKNDAITYEEFENLFSFLSRREQYSITDILAENKIQLQDYDNRLELSNEDETNTEDEIIEIEDGTDTDEEEFKILYDDDIFKDSKADDTGEYQQVYSNIKQSNEILCHLIQEGNKQAKQDICVKNRRLVDKYAIAYEKYYGNHLSFDDIEQAGMIGLIKASERFDFNQGTAFSTYAVFWIRQAIAREIYDNGFAIRVPVHMMEQIVKVTRLDSKYAAQELEFQDRMQAISDEMGCPVEFVEYCLIIRKNYLSYSSLNTPVGEDEDTEIQDLVRDEEATSVEDIVAATELHEMLLKILDTLTEREQKVLILRYGLLDGKKRTLEEVGKIFNVTRERIRQIEAKALRKCRHPSRSRKIKDFYN